MRYFELVGSSLLFFVIFIIGLNLLYHSSDYKDDWGISLRKLSLNYNEVLIIECFGGLLVLFSLFSLFFRQQNFDLVLLFLLSASTSVVYNPFNSISSPKTKINIALIACMLLQRRKLKNNNFIIKKDS